MIKRVFLLFSILMISSNLYAYSFGMRVSNVFVVVYESGFYGSSDYIASINTGLISETGEVELLLKKASFSDIGTSGKYKVSFEDLGNNFYRIKGTSFVLEISSYITSYTDYILDLSLYGAEIFDDSSF